VTVRRVAVLLCLLLSPLVAAAPLAQAAAHAQASFIDIENDVMCVACHEPLALAQSPEAFSERSYIRQLIFQGLDKTQIEKQLVAQYGAAVLGKPPARGFNLLIYILPPAILVIGLGTLAITLPRWRRRSRLGGSSATGTPPPLDPEDARRLEEDLARQP
jgi:cytochrome c-type biogenesis protein CcmH